MGTIERLEALERAATAGPFKVYRECDSGRLWNKDGNKMIAHVRREEDIALFIAMRESFTALLAVAKAAKKMRSYQDGGDDYGGMGPALNNQVECAKELDAALAQLEATP